MSDTQQPSFEWVKSLQQERDRALEDAVKWRRRYEIEAQQRRTEAEVADRTIRNLRAEVQQLCHRGSAVARPPVTAIPSDDSTHDGQNILPELARLAQSRDELAEALAQEQQQHAKTRENLISALGEALQRGKS
jgi:hypothetical protein